jgi:hypothetical protein
MGIVGHLVEHLYNEHHQGYRHPDLVLSHQEEDIRFNE